MGQLDHGPTDSEQHGDQRKQRPDHAFLVAALTAASARQRINTLHKNTNNILLL
jgi:hypothetical protein